ncbi:MAG: twin-arginine translocase subunit TatC [Nanoarchaeota archaeon]|nr:twin-arginine translocase subunit TatC [Nanoarchaeota archaeon]
MRQPLIEHLDELRKRLLVIIIWVGITFFVGVFLSPIILKQMLSDLLIANVPVVVLTPVEFIYTQLRLGLLFAIVVSSPIILYEAILFFKPAATKREMAAVRYFIPGFFLLFFVGAAFAYLVFLKVTLYFLASLSGLADIQNLWSVKALISFILTICIALGFVFELPLILIMLKKLNLISVGFLKRQRPYIYVGIFVLAAIITPPDVVTQVLIAIPLVLLYEVSLTLLRYF